MKGYVQVLTGDGKGKTTAALGLALRAAGAGLRVFIAQFAKKGEYSELKSLKRFEDIITIKQYGRTGFIVNDITKEDINCALRGLKEVGENITSGKYQLVILDEANIATYFKLFSAQKLLEIINSRPEHVEIVITGRNADPLIIENADLVTEMREIKHYFEKGVRSRKGIEE
ncbi:cob(I)yrinic acid a,c-diamide adenosyltransferase [Candidatus Latescibacterota bacterium]